MDLHKRSHMKNRVTFLYQYSDGIFVGAGLFHAAYPAACTRRKWPRLRLRRMQQPTCPRPVLLPSHQLLRLNYRMLLCRSSLLRN